VGGALLCAALAALARGLSGRLPITPLISSPLGWTILLVSTAALGASAIPPVRRLGHETERLGYPLLYLVLAATGAQGSLQALGSAPMWLVVGLCAVGAQGLLLLAVGRGARIPLGLLATASQANVGGLVSAPLVGATYHPSLAPVGLLLAMAGGAVGTYVGLVAAALSRGLM
jgi:uncharacterized membrane protein